MLDVLDPPFSLCLSLSLRIFMFYIEENGENPILTTQSPPPFGGKKFSMNTFPYQQEPHFFPNQQCHGLMMEGVGGPHCTSSYQQEEPHMSGEVDRMMMMTKGNTRNRGAGAAGGGGGKGGGVRLSTDPQSVAARERRHRISDRFKILQSLVPGGSKMDTVSMLEEAIHYVKFLKTQIWLHQALMVTNHVDDDQDQQLLINPSTTPLPLSPQIIPSFQASCLDDSTATSFDHHNGIMSTLATHDDPYHPFPSSTTDHLHHHHHHQLQSLESSYSSALPPLQNEDFSWSFHLEDGMFFSHEPSSNVNYYLP